MTAYVDHEARDIAGEVFGLMEEVGVKLPKPHSPTSKLVGRDELLTMVADIISISLEPIREERFEAGEEAGWQRGYEEGDDDARTELAKPLAPNRHEAVAARAWGARLADAGLDAETIAVPEDWGRVTIAMEEHEAYRVLRALGGTA